MRKTSKKIFAITLAIATAASMTACGGNKETTETEAPVVTTEAATEKQTEAPVETAAETKAPETTAEPVIWHAEKGDTSWTHNTGFDEVYGSDWGYTQEELDRMQFTLDNGTRCTYLELLDATNDDNASWRGHYQKELDDLYDEPIYAVQNIPESDWTSEYKNIIKPLMENRTDGIYMFQKDVSPLALRTIFCCTQDDLGLIDAGFAAKNTLYMTNTETGVKWATFDNDDLRNEAVDGVFTNARVLLISLCPNYKDDNGYWNQCTARVCIALDGVGIADDGMGYDFSTVASADLVYVNNKNSDYHDGQWLVCSCHLNDAGSASEYMFSKSDLDGYGNNWNIYAGENNNYDFISAVRRDVYGSDVYATAE